ncbi:MAG: FixH family protein [Spirosomataceae bacterium]
MEKKKSTFSFGTGIALAYTSFVVFMLYMVYRSVTQKDIFLVTESYYEEELKYQDKIDQMTLANQLSSKATLEVEGNEILLTFPKESVGTSGEIAFYRPSNPAFDFNLPLAISDTAMVVSAPKTMQKGLWEAHISWVKEGKTYLERIKFQR